MSATTETPPQERRYPDSLGIEYVLRTDDPELDLETAFIWLSHMREEEYVGTKDDVCAYRFKLVEGWLDYEDPDRDIAYVTGECLERHRRFNVGPHDWRPFQIDADLKRLR